MKSDKPFKRLENLITKYKYFRLSYVKGNDFNPKRTLMSVVMDKQIRE